MESYKDESYSKDLPSIEKYKEESIKKFQVIENTLHGRTFYFFFFSEM
jgi:hypothetical protein